MFFFGWVYLGLFITSVQSLHVAARLFSADRWEKHELSAALTGIVGLRLIGYVGTAVVATLLLRAREWVWVKHLRLALGVQVLFSGFALIIDQVYFPSTLYPNTLRWGIGCAWIIYFCLSDRVRMVFLTRNWG